MQTLRGFEDWAGRRNLFELQALQQTTPHFLQWWRRFTNVNWTFLQCMHVPASLSGTHTAACSSTAFFPDLRNRSSMHLLMCAIHSCFSVAVAANTAKDLPLVHRSHPFLNWPSSSNDFNLTSSRGIKCCLLYFFLLITMFPYTSRSLKRKNCLFEEWKHI